MNTARRNIQVLSLGVLVAVGLVPLACGGSNKNSANANFSFGTDGGDPNAGQPCAPGQPCPPPQQNCAPGQPCPPPPAASSAAPQGCGQPGQPACTPLDPNMLGGLLGAASAWFGPLGAGDPSALGLSAAAAKYASGMSPEGQPAKGQIQQNGHIQFIVNMDASKCYTIVAYGAGVADLDLNLLAPPFYNVSAGTDGMAGPTAVIGGNPKMCPAIPVAIPYKVDIFAKSGGGQVAAQVYSKAK